MLVSDLLHRIASMKATHDNKTRLLITKVAKIFNAFNSQEMTDKVEKQANVLKSEYNQKITVESCKNDILFNKFEKMRYEYYALQNEHVISIRYSLIHRSL